MEILSIACVLELTATKAWVHVLAILPLLLTRSPLLSFRRPGLPSAHTIILHYPVNNGITMASSMSTTSYCTFGVLEPLLQIAGFCLASFAPDLYISSLRSLKLSRAESPLQETIVVFQLGNLFLLVAVIGLYVLHSTSDSGVATAYLTALWWGDLGHIGVTAWCIGWSEMSRWMHWHWATWANVGIPVCLFIARNLYFYGPSSGSY